MPKGTDYLYIALGAGALWLTLRNTQKISENIITPVSQVVGGAASTINPLLSAASKGAEILTNPKSYETYLGGLLKAPFTTEQSWRLFKQQPGPSEFINAVFTSVGLFK